MPTQVYEMAGEVTVYDGENAAELAELTGTDPVPDDAGAITLQVPMMGSAQSVTLAPGDGLAHRMFGTFVHFSAETLAQYQLVTQ